jgi:hypothetical protein
MKRTVLLTTGCIVLVGVLWLVWAFRRDHRLYRNFGRIRTGTSEQEVIEMLGEPKRVENCGEFWGPIPKAELQGCVNEFFYASPFAPLLPQYYVIRFDANRRVVSLAAYSSP